MTAPMLCNHAGQAAAEPSRGFTLIELMIVVAIIVILAAIAVPNFIAYRNKAYVAANVKSANAIRSALAGYAAVQSSNSYPSNDQIPDWPAFKGICNMHGASLAPTLLNQGLSYFEYHGIDSVGNMDSCVNTVSGPQCADYCIVLRVSNVPQDVPGVQLEIRSSGILRQTY